MSRVKTLPDFVKEAGLPPAKGKIYYLASPYSSDDPLIKEMRYVMVCAFSAALHNEGYNLIEPIGASHPIAKTFDLPTGYDYWKERDRLMIDKSDGVIVCQLNGWNQSVGVTDEIEYAITNNKPVFFVDPKKVLASLSQVQQEVRV